MNYRDGKIVRRRDREGEASDEQLTTFLSLFAATCNVKASALEAGIEVSAIYRRRMNDAAFKAAWAAAQDQGVANLKAEMVRRGLALLDAANPDEAALLKLEGMDAKLILSLIGQHERSLGREPGDIKPRRSDASEAAARLQAVLVRMRLERKKELEVKRALRGA